MTIKGNINKSLSCNKSLTQNKTKNVDQFEKIKYKLLCMVMISKGELLDSN